MRAAVETRGGDVETTEPWRLIQLGFSPHHNGACSQRCRPVVWLAQLSSSKPHTPTPCTPPRAQGLIVTRTVSQHTSRRRGLST